VSTLLYLVNVNNLLNGLAESGFGSMFMSICCGNPAYADDISLLALTPFYLQRMIDIVYQSCQHWNVSIHVENSSVAVFTKSRLHPSVNIFYGSLPMSQTDSFVHPGNHYSYNLKNKDRI